MLTFKASNLERLLSQNGSVKEIPTEATLAAAELLKGTPTKKA